MMFRKISTLLLLLTLFWNHAPAQVGYGNTGSDNPVDRARALTLMDRGVELMEAGEYKDADLYFRRVLASLKVLPAEITFYFGKNSFFLKEYKQSIDWLDKYIQLKGARGQFYDETIRIKKQAEAAWLSMKKEEQQQMTATNLPVEPQAPCQEGQYVRCPVCKGQGVVITPGKFGDEYQTCPVDANGRMSCNQYKLYLQGELPLPTPR